ncbi:hypothetical protein CERSUDRAFT_78046 [Gelatoporia subvermispora B]|uniref:DUF6533 domain-containing protein n=1 Tax=Ceriporiopsis subvermispora (strain B) TaxID=914234 RepID=M2P8A1_CERS8|nr:hypothetical protein CERSUDRAFT_78046 [Gelatoporia subvermispora B]
MSASYGPLVDQIIEFVNSGVCNTTLMLYDHVCTVAQEVQFIWGSELTSTIVLFYANRWLILVYAILTVVDRFTSPKSTVVVPEVRSPYTFSTRIRIVHLPFDSQLCCAGLYVLCSRFMPVCALGSNSQASAAFSGIRVYALSGGSRFPSLVVTLLNLVPVGTNAYGYFYRNSFQLLTFPVLGAQCLQSWNISKTTEIRLETGTRVPIIIADSIVLMLTWWKTWATIRMACEHKVKVPLMILLLRDGTLYFMLSSIMITHFLLNLRQLAHVSPDDTSRPSFVREGEHDTVHSQTSSLRFASFMGNMGEMLVHESEDDDRDMVWDDDNVRGNAAHAGLDIQSINHSPDASGAPVHNPSPGGIMEDERQVEQAADYEPLV